MNSSRDRSQIGPPPPYDAECAAVLATMPLMPPLTTEGIPGHRAAADRYMPRPTDEELSRGGGYTVEHRSVPGPAGAPDVGLLLCRPVATTAPTPALFHIHGGGMIFGTARDVLAEVLDLAQAVGGAVVSVDYRLAPETPHPGPVEDCYAGLTWVAEHAGELGIDPQRLVISGRSSGGGLAAATALMARDRRAPALAGQLLICPMLDDRNDSLSVLQMAEEPMWNHQANAVGWTALLGTARGGADVSPYAAPARASDLSGLPPTFIDVGTTDTFRSEDVDYGHPHLGGRRGLRIARVAGRVPRLRRHSRASTPGQSSRRCADELAPSAAPRMMRPPGSFTRLEPFRPGAQTDVPSTGAKRPEAEGR